MSTPRQRNRRGQGARLHDDILAAAARVLDRDGVEGLSLRAVARETGIAAPSIYAHFADRDAVLTAVVELYLARLLVTVTAARDAHDDPVDALLASANAYARFAAEEPAGYRALFGRIDRTGPPFAARAPFGDPGTDQRDRQAIGLDAFDHLVEGIAACVAAGRSASRDPFADAVCVWAGVHGLVMLHAGLADFPYPALTETVEAVVRRAALIHD